MASSGQRNGSGRSAADPGARYAAPFLEAVLRTMRQPLLVLDSRLTVETANRAFYEMFQVNLDETIGRKVYALGDGQWDIAELRLLLEEVLPHDREVEDFRVDHEFEGLGRRVMLVNGRRIALDGEADRILLAFEDVTAQEAALEAARAQRDYAEKIIDASRDPLLVLDLDLRVQTANLTFLEHFQVKAEDTLGRLVFELGDGQWDIPELRKLLEDVLPDNDAFDNFQVEHDFEQIGPRTMMLNARRVDHVQLILLAIEDRTEARLAESALRKRETQLRHVLDGMGECFGLMDRNFVILEQNEAALATDGRPREEIIGRTHWEAFPGSEDSVLGRLYKQALAENRPVHLEHHFEWPEGGASWLDMRAYPVPEGLAVFWRDVTDRKTAEADLRESEARYRNLFEAMEEGYVLLELIYADEQAEGRDPADAWFVEANPAATRLTGLSIEPGARLSELIPGLEPFWGELHGRVARTGEAEHVERFVPELNRWYGLSASRVDPCDGERQGGMRVAVVFNDITERKAAEEHQDMLMAELDHRVKNMLAVVQSLTRQTLRPASDEARRAANRLVGRIQALAKSHNLLATARWDGANIADLVCDALEAYRGATAGRIETGEPDLVLVPRAAQSLTLALHELSTNAAKHGALSVGAGRVRVHWEIEDADAGGRLRIQWREENGPLAAEPGDRTGFGSTLIERTLVYELGGEVRFNFAEDGLKVDIDLPLKKLVRGKR